MHEGVIVGCDLRQEWLLPWWWNHYSAHNSHPVAFFDFGMSEEGKSWCRKRGECLPLPPCAKTVSSPETIPPMRRACWEQRYGPGIWMVREAWMKKPRALLHCPYPLGLWIDLDCQILGSIDPLFGTLRKGSEFCVRRDRHLVTILPDEIHYNSGVIAFRREAPIIRQWFDLILASEDLLPGDEEFLSRAIYLHKTRLIEMPRKYHDRWDVSKPGSVVKHFSGGEGKIQIFNTLDIEYFREIGLPKRPR